MDLKEVSKKRQKKWKETDLYKVKEDTSKPKFYILDMFPYPSGSALHVGHPKGYIATDCLARKKMLEGFNVLHPMGFDTFGLGTEQYAIEHKMKPQDVSKINIDKFISQLENFGTTYDRSRSVNTADPKYFRRTQRIFLQMYNHYYDEKLQKAMTIASLKLEIENGTLKIDGNINEYLNSQRLAYVDYKPINRCPHCMTGLANEDLDDGKCERCGSEVEQKPMKQRVLRITKYADRLLTGLSDLQRDESMKDLERNWIGKSEGTEFQMKIITEEKNKAAWMVIEKSIEPTALKELLSFGETHIEETDSDRGNFYRILIDKKEEKKFIAFLSNNLKTKGNTGEPSYRYADSDGTTNMVVFSGGKIFDTSTDEGCKEAENFGISVGIPEHQVKFSPRIYAPGYKDHSKRFSVYTTRIDTVFGMSFVAIAPEHQLVEKITTTEHKANVEIYKEAANKKSQLERTELQKDKTGIFCGAYAINPFNGEKVPVFVADYVLANYGTGVVMAVPAHDERDFEFAKKYNSRHNESSKQSESFHDVEIIPRDELPITQSIMPDVFDPKNPPRKDKKDTERDTVHVILRNTKEKTILVHFLKGDHREGVKPQNFIIGGIEEGETALEAAIREIKEETGYTNITFIEQIPFEIQANFFAAHKDVNRKIHVNTLVFDLTGDERVEITEDEHFTKDTHEVHWIPYDKVAETVNIVDDELSRKYFYGGGFAYTEKGVLMNSQQFTGLTSDEAIKKMQGRLAEKGIGGVKVNYKIQDRVFSRQRYRGEPFPVVWTEEAPRLSVNFYNNKARNAIIDGVKTIETRALNPQEPDKYFGDVKVGDILQFHNKEFESLITVKITKVYHWANFASLWKEDKKIIEQMFYHKADFKKVKTIEDLKAHRNFLDGYVERIEKNGLVGREFDIIQSPKKAIALDENILPLELPDVENYEPTGTEEGPLANITDWVNVTLPDGTKAKRETNTMPGRAGSSRYWLRYMDVNNEKELVGKDKEKYRGNVDVYVGGAEHITRHIIYGRFWQNFLYDIGVVSKKEPFQEYHSVGLIMGEDGRKMSKRRGNVVNPDDIINEFGTDVLRAYEMFMGPFDQSIAWSTNGIKGVKKFLEKIVALKDKITDEKETDATMVILHQSIKKLTDDIDAFRFNTGISQLMILVNHLTDCENISRKTFEDLVILVSPFAPHLAEELREQLGNEYSVFTKTTWPKYAEKYLIADTVNIGVQVNGKVRGTISITKEAEESNVMNIAKADEKIAQRIVGEPKKVIYVKGKILNIVI